MKRFTGFEHGMGIGGWLTNYKRFHVLPQERRLTLTVGDMEHFEGYITEADVRYIAELGMDHVRLGFDQIVVEGEPFVYREEILCLIDRLIAQCQKHGLNVVLNLHKAVGNYCDVEEARELLDDPVLQDRFVALWQAFERRYASEEHVAFELLNEVRDVDPEKWNTLAARTVDALRAMNPKRRLIIGSTSWNSPKTLAQLRLYEDENVIYTFHMYAPFEFTHQQGVLQPDPLFYNRQMPYPGDIERYRDYRLVVKGDPNYYRAYTQMDASYLRDALKPATDFVKAHPDKILWCGEFGTIRHAALAWRENWMRDVIRILKEHEIPYCVWNYLSMPNDGNRFSLVDDDGRKILSRELARIIKGDV